MHTHLLRYPSWQLLSMCADLTNQRPREAKTCGDLGLSDEVLEARRREIEAVVGRTYGLN